MTYKRSRTYTYAGSGAIMGGKIRVEIIPDRQQDQDRPHALYLDSADSVALYTSLRSWFDYFERFPDRARAQGWPTVSPDTLRGVEHTP